MASKDAFASYCAELLAPLGPVRVKRMFGGHGLYVDDLFIAIVVGETLYLKTDDTSAPRFQAAGGQAFTYAAKGNRIISMKYWSPPVEAMDSPSAMRPWGELALKAALSARGK
jgi:DNA transformation protein